MVYSLIEVGPGSPSLYIWVVQPTGKTIFEIFSLEDSGIFLGDLLQQNRETIGVRGRGGFIPASNIVNETEQLRQLHQLLIEPIAEYLPDDPDQRIIFIPHG